LQSFLWHPGFAQPGEECGLDQGTEISEGLQPGDVGKTVVAAQPSGFGEFDGGAFSLAFEATSATRPSPASRFPATTFSL